jgi:hypothetical protein
MSSAAANSKRRMITVAQPKFHLGKLVATPGALDAVTDSGQHPWLDDSMHNELIQAAGSTLDLKVLVDDN